MHTSVYRDYPKCQAVVEFESQTANVTVNGIANRTTTSARKMKSCPDIRYLDLLSTPETPKHYPLS